MVSLSNIQNKLLIKVFNNLGSTVSVSTITSSTDKWGDNTTTNTVSVDHIAVPFYDYFSRKSFNPFGVVTEGQIDMLFKHDSGIVKGLVVTFDSKVYDVFNIEKYPLQDGNIAILTRLQEQLA